MVSRCGRGVHRGVRHGGHGPDGLDRSFDLARWVEREGDRALPFTDVANGGGNHDCGDLVASAAGCAASKQGRIRHLAVTQTHPSATHAVRPSGS